MNNRYLLAVLVLVLGCLALPAPAQEAAPIIREIVFRGVVNVPAAEMEAIRGRLRSEVGQPLNRETVQADLETILESGWFTRADARSETVETGVRVAFVLVENPVLTEVAFIGNTEELLGDAQLLALVRSQPGTVLNRNLVTQDALALKRAYADRGYILVDVTDINVTPEGRLEFYIFEPKIGEIRIEGNRKTKDYVILRELEIEPGDVYNEREIRQSLLNLERLNIFQEVTAVPEPGDQPGTLIITVRVVERRTGLASFGAGHSNVRGLIGFVDLSDTNLFGTGQRLSARAQFGADSSYSLSYTHPHIDARRTSMTLNLYDRSILRQAIQGGNEFLYNEERSGGNITFGRPVSLTTRAFVTLRADSVSASEEDGRPVPAILLQEADVRSIAVSAVRDTRNSFLNPSRGSYTTSAVEFAGFGGADFTKVTGELRRYWVMRERRASEADVAAGRRPVPWVLASRLSAGGIAGSPPFLDQFLVGGANTLRGYKEDRFPGENMVLLNNELRIPLSDTIQVAAFVDLGSAWGGDFARQFGDTSLDLHYGYGLGIRIQTPIGPLRLDYGIAGDGGNEFHFGIGPTF